MNPSQVVNTARQKQKTSWDLYSHASGVWCSILSFGQSSHYRPFHGHGWHRKNSFKEQWFSPLIDQMQDHDPNTAQPPKRPNPLSLTMSLFQFGLDRNSCNRCSTIADLTSITFPDVGAIQRSPLWPQCNERVWLHSISAGTARICSEKGLCAQPSPNQVITGLIYLELLHFNWSVFNRHPHTPTISSLSDVELQIPLYP